MTEILHAWAIAPAAIGACCLAADRGRVRWPELAASALMLLAMLDASVTRAVSPVYWAALLLVGAMAVALWRSPRRRRGRVMPRTGDDRMTLHTTLGMVAMAALQVGMHGAAVTVAAGTHSHHGGGGLLQAALLAGAIAYAAFTVLLVRRAHGLLDRAQFVAMGASVALMAIGTLL